MRRVFIVDDHPVVRAGFRALVEAEPDFTVVGEADSSEAAQRALARDPQVDILLTDLSLGGANGLELVKALSASHPHIPVLVVSMHPDELYAERALQAGARGYVNKDGALDELSAAIRDVCAGRVYLSPAMTRRVLSRMAGDAAAPEQGVSSLSDRELEVFERLGEGLTTREVAEALHLSVKTIETYRANIKRKLGLRTSAELAQRAFAFKHDP